MQTALRPLTLGEILDRTAQLYRTNFVLFAGIFSLYTGVSLVLGLAQIGVSAWMRSAHLLRYLTAVTFSIAGVELLLVFLLLGAAIAAISRAVAWVNLGETVTIRGAYSSVMPRMGRYLWLMTLTAIIVYIPIGLLYGAYFGMLAYFGFTHQGAAAAKPDESSLMLVGVASLVFILLLVPVLAYTIFMTLRYALAVPACVVENLTARAALRRSVDLSKGARGRIFVLGLLIGVIKIGLVLISQLFFLVAVVKHHGQVSSLVTALSQIVGFFTNTFIGPIGATGVTLFYYDQRVRKEGYDIEWMMQSAGMTAPPPVPDEPAMIDALPAADLSEAALPEPGPAPVESHEPPADPNEPPAAATEDTHG